MVTSAQTGSMIGNKNARKEYWEEQFGTSYQVGDLAEDGKQLLSSLVKNLKLGRMLDDGCGDGRLKKFYENLGWEVYGTDMSANAIKRACVIAPLNLVCCFSENLPFKNGFFDVVLSWRVLHNLVEKERKETLNEIERVLKSRGTFLCAVQSTEDEITISKYKSMGTEVAEDKNSFLLNLNIEGKNLQRLRHFYTKEDIVNEIETNTAIKIQEIQSYEEKSILSNDIQKYWIVRAIKQ